MRIRRGRSPSGATQGQAEKKLGLGAFGLLPGVPEQLACQSRKINSMMGADLRRAISVKLSLDFSFDAAHRIMDHAGKCAWLHGHTYRLRITVEAEGLDPLGMVMDFDDLKALAEKHLLVRWDHATFLRADDPLVPAIVRVQAEAPQRVVTFRQNPTVEVLAQTAAETLIPALPAGIRLARLAIWESPTCSSEVEP